MFCFLAVLIGFPPTSQVEPDTYRIMSGTIGPSIRGEALTSGSSLRALGVNTLKVYRPWKLWVLLNFDICDEDIRHVFIYGSNCRLVMVIGVGGRFRISATGQSFGALDLSLEITT